MSLDRYAKAVVAGLTAFGGLWVMATNGGTPGGEGVTSNEWVSILVPTFIAALSVWAVPNADPPKKPEAPAGYVGRARRPDDDVDDRYLLPPPGR